jgi:hypothetical protein
MGLVEVINFNSDASCLDSRKWLYSLEGGGNSRFMQVLMSYVEYKRKTNLGLTGATIHDLVYFNPEAIDFINEHSDTFQLVIRSYAHDSPLLRLPDGFRFNLETGIEVIRQFFSNISNSYLQPEIIITGEQISILKEFGVENIFIHIYRYHESIRAKIPIIPFRVSGTLDTDIGCIPFVQKSLEDLYLLALHGVISPKCWSQGIIEAAAMNTESSSDIYIWRDGESSLLIPNGIEYEASLLESEHIQGITRQFLSETSFDYFFKEQSHDRDLRDNYVNFFPTYSMKPWFNEMKLYWFISRIHEIESQFTALSNVEKKIWLLLINSDILSAVEKKPPTISVSKDVFSVDPLDISWIGVLAHSERSEITLMRSERSGEAEDYLAYWEKCHEKKASLELLLRAWSTSSKAYLQKAYARIKGLAADS